MTLLWLASRCFQSVQIWSYCFFQSKSPVENEPSLVPDLYVLFYQLWQDSTIRSGTNRSWQNSTNGSGTNGSWQDSTSGSGTRLEGANPYVRVWKSVILWGMARLSLVPEYVILRASAPGRANIMPQGSKACLYKTLCSACDHAALVVQSSLFYKSDQSLFVTCAEYTLQWNAYLQALTNGVCVRVCACVCVCVCVCVSKEIKQQ
jgi:hypothetical protein